MPMTLEEIALRLAVVEEKTRQLEESWGIEKEKRANRLARKRLNQMLGFPKTPSLEEFGSGSEALARDLAELDEAADLRAAQEKEFVQRIDEYVEELPCRECGSTVQEFPCPECGSTEARNPAIPLSPSAFTRGQLEE